MGKKTIKSLILMIISFFLLILVFLLIFPKFKKQNHETPGLKIIPTKKPIKKLSSIFVPSWALVDQSGNSLEIVESQLKQYDRMIYFGAEAGKDGIKNPESRIISLSAFAKASADKDKWLTIIMTNSDVNIAILQDKLSWSKIIADSIKIAKENNFSGIALDLEMSTIPFNRIVNDIVDFNKSFYQAAKNANLQYGFLVYGDTFYRKRPYYLPEINKSADEIMIMAYDFHKSRGEPGPNFPLARRSENEGGPDRYAYDFKTMTTDFLKVIPAEKLTIIFGMYGYDWQVDEKRLPITPAKALTLAQIKKQFNNCMDATNNDSGQARMTKSNCLIRRDDLSKETEIDYVKSWVINEFGYMDYHIVWFEDETSVDYKRQFLLEKGIGSVGYWAYSYF